MKNFFLFSILIVLIASCSVGGGVSFKKNAANGFTTNGINLACENANIFIADEEFNENILTYGELVAFKFEDVSGFTSKGGKVFPGMKLSVTNSEGEEVIKYDDFYAESGGFPDQSGLILTADLVLGQPIYSGDKYKVSILIWDKNGAGTLKGEYSFELIENEALTIKASDIEYNEIYLFSENEGNTITGNVVSKDDKIYLLFEGLTGFTSEEGMIFPGLNMVITDSEGNELMSEDDLLSDFSDSGLDEEQFNKQMKTNFSLNEFDFEGSVHVYVMIWDKKTDAFIEAEADLEVE